MKSDKRNYYEPAFFEKAKLYRSNLILFSLVLVLTAFGLNTLLSASSFLASEQMNDSMFFLKRQLIYAGLGLILLVTFSQVDYSFWKKMAWPIYVFSLILLALVYFPPLGKKAGGAWRWLAIGPFSIQPSDIARLAVILLLARLSSQVEKYRLSLILLFAVIVAAPVLLIAFEQDLSTAMHLLVTAGVFLFFTSFPLWVHGLAFLVAVPFGVTMIILEPFRLERIKAVLDPWKYRFDSAYQLVASFKSFLSGGLWGKGLGEGLNRHNLQARHTDFILAIVAEDLGFIGIVVLLTLIFALAIYVLVIMMQTEDDFARYLGTGIILTFIIQVGMNAMVTMGLIPTTGIGLPLFSYGGTSLIIYLAMFGMLLSLTRERAEKKLID